MAKKIVTLYQLADEQLSKQHHYDWSLRSLKAVIKLAAKMRLHQLSVCESVILIQALHQINLSKLIFEDVPLFSGLIKVIWNVTFCFYATSVVFFLFFSLASRRPLLSQRLCVNCNTVCHVYIVNATSVNALFFISSLSLGTSRHCFFCH